MTKSPIGSIEAKISAAAGGVPHPNFWDIERRDRESRLGRVVSCMAPRSAVSQWQSLHTFLHTENALIAA